MGLVKGKPSHSFSLDLLQVIYSIWYSYSLSKLKGRQKGEILWSLQISLHLAATVSKHFSQFHTECPQFQHHAMTSILYANILFIALLISFDETIARLQVDNVFVCTNLTGEFVLPNHQFTLPASTLSYYVFYIILATDVHLLMLCVCVCMRRITKAFGSLQIP